MIEQELSWNPTESCHHIPQHWLRTGQSSDSSWLLIHLIHVFGLHSAQHTVYGFTKWAWISCSFCEMVACDCMACRMWCLNGHCMSCSKCGKTHERRQKLNVLLSGFFYSHWSARLQESVRNEFAWHCWTGCWSPSCILPLTALKTDRSAESMCTLSLASCHPLYPTCTSPLKSCL